MHDLKGFIGVFAKRQTLVILGFPYCERIEDVKILIFSNKCWFWNSSFVQCLLIFLLYGVKFYATAAPTHYLAVVKMTLNITKLSFKLLKVDISS